MKIKTFIIFLLIPLLVGIIGTILGNTSMGYETINKPSFTPPGIIFPIVWTILYILMGISSYLVFKKEKNIKYLKIYFVQLFFNMTWTLFFFNFKTYLFSFIWLLILLTLVIVITYKFYKSNKISGLLQIPYIIWLIFASVLNLSIFILN